MNINITKTKEMIVGVNVNPPPQLIISAEIIESVFVYKLLGVLIDTNLKWDNHIFRSLLKTSFHYSSEAKQSKIWSVFTKR